MGGTTGRTGIPLVPETSPSGPRIDLRASRVTLLGLRGHQSKSPLPVGGPRVSGFVDGKMVELKKEGKGVEGFLHE